MADAIQVSKLRWRLQDESLRPLTIPEAFWMGTLGGGAFFGKVGTFREGYEADAVVLDDSRLAGPREFSITERLEPGHLPAGGPGRGGQVCGRDAAVRISGGRPGQGQVGRPPKK